MDVSFLLASISTKLSINFPIKQIMTHLLVEQEAFHSSPVLTSHYLSWFVYMTCTRENDYVVLNSTYYFSWLLSKDDLHSPPRSDSTSNDPKSTLLWPVQLTTICTCRAEPPPIPFTLLAITHNGTTKDSHEMNSNRRNWFPEASLATADDGIDCARMWCWTRDVSF